MPYTYIKAISLEILGENASTTYVHKVLLVMYYSELLALNFQEIESLFNKVGREKILNVFYLDSNFINYAYEKFCNSEIKSILEDIYDRLVKIQELFYYNRIFHSDNISPPQ